MSACTDWPVPLEGGCACGTIRYRLERTPMYVHCCSCHACQRETGSAFALNVLIEFDQCRLLPQADGTVTLPRQIAMYLTRELNGASLPRIGADFGGRDHTTVLHACEKIAEDIQRDAALKGTVESLKKRIQGA